MTRPRSPNGSGSIEVLRGAADYVTLRPRIQRNGTRYYGESVGIRRGRTQRERERYEREAWAAARQNLAALRQAVQGGEQPEPAKPLTAPPTGETSLPGFHALNDQRFRRWLWERDGGICGLCHTPVELVGMHIDHIQTRRSGGTDHESNLRVTHGHCNISRMMQARLAARAAVAPL